jgi:hypothetical protein
MSDAGPTLRFKFRARRRLGRIELDQPPTTPDGRPALPRPPTSPPVPRITRQVALAHKFQRMLDEGKVASMADIARLGRVTCARVTQIMDLLLLAPDIQEALLSGIIFSPVRCLRKPGTHPPLPLAAGMGCPPKQSIRLQSIRSLDHSF